MASDLRADIVPALTLEEYRRRQSSRNEAAGRGDRTPIRNETGMSEREPYTGPIEVGMTFLWEPMKPWATEHVKVVEVKDNGEELWMTTKGWEPTSRVSGDYTGPVYWNSEDRFREAVVLVEVTTPPSGARLA